MMELPEDGLFVGRVWRPDVAGPAVVVRRKNGLFDITNAETPTMRDLLERDDAAEYARQIDGIRIEDPGAPGNSSQLHLLAPCDLQAIKACGVTFAGSMVERVIEERCAGDPMRAAEIRARVTTVIGDTLRHIIPGSPQAAALKGALLEEGLWSQYLEVGIGPDAEVFTKAQPMSAVGHRADVGLHPGSTWNNPEPEVVLVVDSRGRVRGATLGNDVNLRDVEGRSALLLGKAKDNNASCAVGPMIRMFDDSFGMADVRALTLDLRITGEDGFVLTGTSSMAEISRDPLDLVAQTCGAHHQYPDGFVLFLGTMFAPVQDRDLPGQGFTHHMGDTVRIFTPQLGGLINRVCLSGNCDPWTFGTGALMRNLAARGLLNRKDVHA